MFRDTSAFCATVFTLTANMLGSRAVLQQGHNGALCYEARDDLSLVET